MITVDPFGKGKTKFLHNLAGSTSTPLDMAERSLSAEKDFTCRLCTDYVTSTAFGALLNGFGTVTLVLDAAHMLNRQRRRALSPPSPLKPEQPDPPRTRLVCPEHLFGFEQQRAAA